MSFEYKNKVGKVPVGELYDVVKFSDKPDIQVGETIVGWDEPDIHGIEKDGSQVDSMLITGVVDKIYKRPNGPEISIKNAGIGRLDVESPHFQNPAERPDRFLNSNTDGSIVEYWYDGTYDIELND